MSWIVAAVTAGLSSVNSIAASAADESAQILLRLLVSDEQILLRFLASDEPPTGEMMEAFSKRIKASIRCIDVHEFNAIARDGAPVYDARSPGEFAIGHIPGARNLPLFSDSERATVGTLFKSAGRSSAMVRGMSIVKPKMDTLVSTAAAIVGTGDVLLLHCWRGGMRSCALAFLLQTRIPGLQVRVLKGGYKAFRTWQYKVYCHLPENASYDASYDVNNSQRKTGKKIFPKTKKKRLKLAAREAATSGVGIAKREAAIAKVRALRGEEDAKDVAAAAAEREVEADASARAEAEWGGLFAKGPRIAIIGGPTGSGKTKVLHVLRDVLGEQIIDLEGLANHSGSAFGFVGHAPQPTPQQYTNIVAMQWASLDPKRWVFIEDEGHHVGQVSLPVGLYRKMRATSVVLKLDVPKDIRVQVLREDYALPEKGKGAEGKGGGIEREEELSEWLNNMVEATQSLEKRIGRVRMEAMITLLRGGDYAEFARMALEYYDDLYHKHITNEHGSANMTGTGLRAAAIRTVNVDMEWFDAEKVARQVQEVMKGVRYSVESTQPARVGLFKIITGIFNFFFQSPVVLALSLALALVQIYPYL
jgi:tRNA 2-selenouridine synthase SelU